MREQNTEYILSLSYGKDSLACLGAIRHLGWPLDRIVTADVWATDTIPAEYPPVVAFKAHVDAYILEHYGIAVDHYPNATEEAVERVAEAASSMKLSPEAVQRILDTFDNIIEAINRMIEWAVWAAKTIVNTIGRAFDDFLLCRAPPKWRHYALHAKRARVRKKYRNRIRRAFFSALASEGGGSS